MTQQRNSLALKKAFEKSLDLLGAPSKKSLLRYLETEYKISFEDNDSALEEIESALRAILGRGADIISDELHKNLEAHARNTRKKPVTSRHAKTNALPRNSINN